MAGGGGTQRCHIRDLGTSFGNTTKNMADMSCRGESTTDAYKVLVSEVMLEQQTQVERVIPFITIS